jgi:uncharacterized protein (TIGR02246 family)
MRYVTRMKRLISLTLASLALSFAPTANAAQAPVTPACEPVDAALVEAQFKRFTDAWATGDAKKVTELFADDAVLLATVSNTFRTTPDQITDYFNYFLRNKPVARVDESVIRLGCDAAARFGNWTIDLTDPQTGAKSTVSARFTFIYRFEDGQWVIDHLHSSQMPEPVAAP